jgi:hypothetical protein
MEFEVHPTRHHGVILPLWQRNHAAVRGVLQVSFESDEDLHRPIKVARLLKGGTEGAVAMPPLYDVELVACRPDLWTLTGFERSDDDRGRPVSYQQSWLLVPADVADRERAHSGPRPSLATPDPHSGILACIGGADLGRGSGMLPPPSATCPQRMTIELVAEHVGPVAVEYLLHHSKQGRSAGRWFWTACKAVALDKPKDGETAQS